MGQCAATFHIDSPATFDILRDIADNAAHLPVCRSFALQRSIEMT